MSEVYLIDGRPMRLPGKWRARYTVLRKLGKGGCGEVYLVKNNEDGALYALKIASYEGASHKDKEYVMGEARILDMISHPNLLKCHDTMDDPGHQRLLMIVEFCKGGDLNAHVQYHKSAGTHFEEKDLWRFLHESVIALSYLHAPPPDELADARPRILHRDLKPHNLLLNEEGRIQIADFGLSKMLWHSGGTASGLGTPGYLPPEMINGVEYGPAEADYFTLGIVFYELTCLRLPFGERGLTLRMMENYQAPFFGYQARYSPEYESVIRQLLSLSPPARPTSETLLSLPQMRQVKREMDLEARELALAQGERQLAKDRAQLARDRDDLTRQLAELTLKQEDQARNENGKRTGSVVTVYRPIYKLPRRAQPPTQAQEGMFGKFTKALYRGVGWE